MQQQSETSSTKLNLEASSPETTQEANQELPEGVQYIDRPKGIPASQVVFKTHLEEQNEPLPKMQSKNQSNDGYIKSFSNVDPKAVEKEAESSSEEDFGKLENSLRQELAPNQFSDPAYAKTFP